MSALLAEVDRVRVAMGTEFDILLYTGYELHELDAGRRQVAALADAVVTGRFEASRPTRLVWRGSANQVLRPQTELGERRYAAYLDHAPARPPVQVRVDRYGVWLVGVPRRGTLSEVERRLRDRGLDILAVSWRRPPSAREVSDGPG